MAFRKANKSMNRRRIDLPMEKIDYKATDILTKFTSETGKILPRRVTGVSAKMHRRITREIKRARTCNLLP
ncbi:30S ribosomal protein S18 [Akkermansiaceae bacterium]|nr:30S ribosomal protein S18 [Akkermansiaceae bacterium]